MAESGESVTRVSSTTLQDIPLEVLDYILMKSVVKTVRGGKLVKSIWKRESFRLIKRLRTVWTQWNYRLTTKWFQVVLERTLDGLGPVPIYGNILARQPLTNIALGVATMKNEIFILCDDDFYGCYDGREPFINVYDRKDLQNMKYSIPLDIGLPQNMVACDLSSCLYVSIMGGGCIIYQITKDGEQYGQATEWKIIEERTGNASITLSFDGSLIVAAGFGANSRIEVYKSDSSLHCYIPLPEARISRSPLQKLNGNFLIYSETLSGECRIVEVDKDGKILHQFVFDEHLIFRQHTLDVHDRLIVLSCGNHGDRLRLFNAEYNELEIAPYRPNLWGPTMHYNRDGDELLVAEYNTLTIFSFAEDQTV